METGVSFSGAVIAGGLSRRMGRDKAFLKFGGEPLIHRQVRVLRECGAQEILISGRRGTDYSSPGTVVLYDEFDGTGPLSGLIAALKAAKYPLILALAVDMPLITPITLLKLVMSVEGCGVVPRDEARFQPLAALYPKSLLPIAERRAESGRILDALICR